MGSFSKTCLFCLLIQATPIGKLVDDLGTPSAPPIVDIGTEAHHSEVADTSGGMTGIEHVTDEINTSSDDGITMQVPSGSKEVFSERMEQHINSGTFLGYDNYQHHYN